MKLYNLNLNKKINSNYMNCKRGSMLISIIIFGVVAVSSTTALTGWFAVSYKANRNVTNDELAFHIAEAGIDYYRWHLAHDSDDFQDGTGEPGPYVHDYFDKDGNKIGEFSLDIVAPELGSTLVTIESTGTLASTSNSKTIRALLAKPSFAKYAFVANSDMRFGGGTEVFGPIHSNEGIRFDGLAHNVISSSLETYDDPDHSGAQEWAVHTHVGTDDPDPPTEWNYRPDVFEAGREVGLPAVDFDGLTSDLSSLKSLSQEVGGLYFGSSGRRGYLAILKTDDTLDVYSVRSLMRPNSSCRNQGSWQENWGTWSVRRTSYLGNYDFPDNGVIFFEDHVWVEGKINSARLTIAAARFPDSPSTRRDITVNNDLEYSNKDGTDVISLMAQRNINVGMYSEDDLIIDAALVAQKGRVGRFYYGSGCSPYHQRNQIDLFGMIGTNERYGFAYTNNTGYDIRNISYDANLLYSPPPEFPLTSDNFEIVSWEEVD